MDGIQMMLTRVLQLVGVKPEELEKIREEIPKLREGIPQFASGLAAKVNQLDGRLANLEAGHVEIKGMLSQILETFGEHVTAQTLPPEPTGPTLIGTELGQSAAGDQSPAKG